MNYNLLFTAAIFLVVGIPIYKAAKKDDDKLFTYRMPKAIALVLGRPISRKVFIVVGLVLIFFGGLSLVQAVMSMF